ncbi:LysR family transcriptional regulator [Fusobacterium ulcerans]|jgi:DNA-binding transcriptional LysR family regulator|uniref:LysR family transcriptional regulator n=1 Tax=Fusobacterium ulcerans TaxID=861 RepID=UPI000E4CA379|nr:LysR family transcriptional regulator [Fusobacterium ulcerans]MBP7739799.1 LysR family transcriptional regulator [Leptotrichiaceae bacterium]RGY59474.1 LysR family transcriptional regulator [Fusobacterium ulcerans]
MTIRHMKIFLTICEVNSITLAAKKLFIAQPSVSYALKELEEFYGVKFFDRISKKLYITEAGEQFLNYSLQIITLLDEMENKIKNNDNLGSLKIGASITIGKLFLSHYIKIFKRLYPTIKISVCIDNSSVIEEKVLNNHLDLGLIEGIIHSTNLITEPFLEDPLVFICSKGHHFLKKSNITLSDLIKESFILREKGSGIREIFDSFLMTKEVTVIPTWESISTDAIINAVKNDIGISLLPYLMVKEELENKSLCSLNIKNIKLKRTFNIIYHKNKFITPTLKHFITTCKDKKSKIEKL